MWKIISALKYKLLFFKFLFLSFKFRKKSPVRSSGGFLRNFGIYFLTLITERTNCRNANLKIKHALNNCSITKIFSHRATA